MEEYMRNTFGFEALRHVFNDSASDVRRKILGIYLVLILFNVIIWALVLLGFAPYPALYGTAALAYSFGLRHAVDADHISAIDNVTRKLMQENKRPVAVGFFFGLGHCNRTFIFLHQLTSDIINRRDMIGID